MASKFYSAIIEEEKKKFKIKKASLKTASESIAAFHSVKSLGKRQSFQPSTVYDKPQSRCVYLYRYATINSGLVTKYFRKLAFKKEVKSSTYFKRTIKVCCLGGGPGTDVFGVFRALAVSPSFHGKITEVTVLDICSGWENMLNGVIAGLLDGEVKDIPSTFTNQKEFTYKLIKVDLLDPLPENIKEIISNADVVCMTRFVSDLLGDRRSSFALKVLGNLVKIGALVLYADVLNEKVFELSEDFSKDNGFATVLGPLHEKFVRPSASEKNVYGLVPQCAATFSIVGWHKTSITSIRNAVWGDSCSITNNSYTESEISSVDLEVYDSEDNSAAADVFDSEDNSAVADVLDLEDNSATPDVLDLEDNSATPDVFDMEDNSATADVFDLEDNSAAANVLDSENNNAALSIHDSENESLNKHFHLCHTYTQTESDFLTHTATSEKEDLLALMKAVGNLISIVELWKQKLALRKRCCHQYQLKKICN